MIELNPGVAILLGLAILTLLAILAMKAGKK